MNTARFLRARTWAAVLVATTGCDLAVAVERGVDPVTADRTVAVLHTHHLGAWKASAPARAGEALFDVRVLADDVPAAVGALRESGAARPRAASDEHAVALPTPNEERQRSLTVISTELERTLHLWAGVVDARVHISVPSNTTLHERAHDETRASVVLRVCDNDAPADAEVQALVSHAVPDLTPGDVKVMRTAIRPALARLLVQVGPIATTAGSAKALRGVLLALLSLTAGLTLALVWLWRRSRNQAD